MLSDDNSNRSTTRVLLQTAPRQRMLAALVQHGPMRKRDALDACGNPPALELRLDNFVDTGLIVQFGDTRSVGVAFNEAFPASVELREVIRSAEPGTSPAPRLRLPVEKPLFTIPVASAAQTVFGPWLQTASIFLLGLSDGSLPLSALRSALRRMTQTANPDVAIAGLQRRKLVSVVKDEICWHPDFDAQALEKFVEALASTDPSYDLRPNLVPPKRTILNRPKSGRIDWRQEEIIGVERPRGGGIASDDSSLLFGSNARLRALSLLAVNGTMLKARLLSSSGISDDTYGRLIDEGWLVRGRGETNRVCVTIAHEVPAREELLSLLNKLSERWPVDKFDVVTSVNENVKKPVRLEKYFGKEILTEMLLTLFRFGSADASTLQRAYPSTGRHEVKRRVLMLAHYGIVRVGEREGSAKMYEFDPHWFAAAELRALLSSLASMLPKLDGREFSKIAQMRPHRQTMRKNALRLKAKQQSDGERARGVH